MVQCLLKKLLTHWENHSDEKMRVGNTVSQCTILYTSLFNNICFILNSIYWFLTILLNHPLRKKISIPKTPRKKQSAIDKKSCS